VNTLLFSGKSVLPGEIPDTPSNAKTLLFLPPNTTALDGLNKLIASARLPSVALAVAPVEDWSPMP
jgi:hypothetical protein